MSDKPLAGRMAVVTGASSGLGARFARVLSEAGASVAVFGLGGIGLSGNHRPAAYYSADYCAYPVASTEMDQPRATIMVGLRS